MNTIDRLSDERLLGLFQAGSEEAFGVLYHRHRSRLLAYVRRMLPAGADHDGEDVVQEVLTTAYRSLRDDPREMNVRAWLYRVAHNRCVNLIVRRRPPSAELAAACRAPHPEPFEVALRRDDLRRLVEDIDRMPRPQRSALLMREIHGMSYTDVAAKLGTTLPAVKSLLSRARAGLAAASAARDTDCGVIHDDLVRAARRGVRVSGRADRHMDICAGCREYRAALAKS